MYLIKIFFGCFLTAVAGIPPTIFSYSVNTIEGHVQSLSVLENKKLMIVTLPVAQNGAANAFLYSLDSLASAQGENLKILAVPSYEDGFTVSQRQALKGWYRSKLRNSIIIADGMHTRKSSAHNQHAVFKWLTYENLNEHFNIDTNGPGHKFFISSSGQLIAVLRSQVPLSHNSINKAITLL